MSVPSVAPAPSAAPAPAGPAGRAAATQTARATTAVSPAMAALAAARSGGRQKGRPGQPDPAPGAQAPEAAPAAPAATETAVAPAQKKTELAPEPDPVIVRLEEPAPVAPEPAPSPIQPVPALGWDGDWPGLATALPVRGVAQQLALQSEFTGCASEGGATQLQLRVPVETLCSAGSVDKLAAALSEHFGQPVRIRTEIGAARDTANARMLARQAERQREAEQAVHSDPFVQTLMREFGATIVPGSIKPV